MRARARPTLRGARGCRPPRTPSTRGLAVAGIPVEARLHARASTDGRLVAQADVDRNGVLDRRERVLEPVGRIRGGGELLEHRRLLDGGEPADERRRATVVGVRLAIRVDGGRAARGEERVLGDGVVVAGGLGVVDDVGGIGVRRDQRVCDLAMMTSPRGDRDARGDRVPGELVTEAHPARLDGEQVTPLRLLRRRRPRGMTASSTEVATRLGTIETSSTSRRPRRPAVRPARRRSSRPRAGDRGPPVGRAARSRRTGCRPSPRTPRRVVAGERGDRALGQRRERDVERDVRADLADRRIERMPGRAPRRCGTSARGARRGSRFGVLRP